ncbi:hypothetical protein KY311_01100 [Candidatus Woesearchaeota archaeon]|nr:hypothetical protein [Candidatus Woesearchaeota archaeon]
MDEPEKIDLADDAEHEEVQCTSCQANANTNTDNAAESSKAWKKAGIVAVIVVALFFFSFIGFKLFSQPEIINTGSAVLKIYSDEYYTYNNFEFRYVDKLWVTEVYDKKTETVYRVPLHYGPKDLLDIEVDKQMIYFLTEVSKYKGPDNRSAVYVTYDPDINSSYVTLSYYELMQNLRDTYGIITYPTFTKEVDFIDNETIKTCDSEEPVIYLRHTSPAYVDYSSKCLILQGENEDMVKATDRALLLLYGIMV